jgi:hypothetical protein
VLCPAGAMEAPSRTACRHLACLACLGRPSRSPTGDGAYHQMCSVEVAVSCRGGFLCIALLSLPCCKKGQAVRVGQDQVPNFYARAPSVEVSAFFVVVERHQRRHLESEPIVSDHTSDFRAAVLGI